MQVPGCGHTVSVPCHVNVDGETYTCNATCGKFLPCGHTCDHLCDSCNKREDGEIVAETHGCCKEICGKPFTSCAHECKQSCHPNKPCGLCELPCSVKCSHSSCQKACCEPCVPCAEDKCWSGCAHSNCTMPCGAPCDWIPCSLHCVESLACGHQCPSVCGALCPDAFFCQVCGADDVKNRTVDLILLEPYIGIDLDENPCIFPDCGHFYTMESLDGHVGISEHYELRREWHSRGAEGVKRHFGLFGKIILSVPSVVSPSATFQDTSARFAKPY